MGKPNERFWQLACGVLALGVLWQCSSADAAEERARKAENARANNLDDAQAICREAREQEACDVGRKCRDLFGSSY